MEEGLRPSVRQWQDRFRAGEFNSRDRTVQCEAGWYDWFCRDEALAGRLKKISKVVMSISDPFILDNYYIWFKNNCPMVGPLYDDVRFEPLAGERDGKYFVVALDSPHEEKKWTLFTERYGYDAPEFECDNVREMSKYINGIAHEMENGIVPAFVTEKQAVEQYIARRCGDRTTSVYREGDHVYSFRSPMDRTVKTVAVSASLEDVPSGFAAEQAEKVSGVYVFGPEWPIPERAGQEKQQPQRKEQAR